MRWFIFVEWYNLGFHNTLHFFSLMKRYQTNSAIGKPYGHCHIVNRGTENEYKRGAYTFKHGVVTFYSEPKFATFTFILNGRIHGLNFSEIKKPLTERQLIIQAGKFGREIVSNFG